MWRVEKKDKKKVDSMAERLVDQMVVKWVALWVGLLELKLVEMKAADLVACLVEKSVAMKVAH